MNLVCSRCGACISRAHRGFKPGHTQPCLNADNRGCSGTMRRVLVNDLKRDAKAKRELFMAGGAYYGLNR